MLIAEIVSCVKTAAVLPIPAVALLPLLLLPFREDVQTIHGVLYIIVLQSVRLLKLVIKVPEFVVPQPILTDTFVKKATMISPERHLPANGVVLEYAVIPTVAARLLLQLLSRGV